MKAKLQKKRNQIRRLCTSLLNQKAEGLIQYEIKSICQVAATQISIQKHSMKLYPISEEILQVR
jgi:hypothetical protein